jgi:hypothetical protein
VHAGDEKVARVCFSATAALARPVGGVAEQVQPAGRPDPGSCGPGVEAQDFGLLGWQGRADPQGGQWSGAAEGSGGPELEPESVGGGDTQFGQGAADSTMAITVGAPAGTAGQQQVLVRTGAVGRRAA